MRLINKRIFKAIAGLFCAAITTVSAAELCDLGLTIGGDALYWSPCVNNMHYAASAVSPFTNEENEVKYHFIDCEWDPGFRVYLIKEDLLGWFDLQLTYTNFSTEKKTGVSVNGTEDLISLTWPTPFPSTYGKYVTADWELDYQRFEATAGYKIEFGRCCGFSLIPFSGLDFLSMDQKRAELIQNQIPRANSADATPPLPTAIDTMKRSVDYCGLGPMAGMGYHYNFFEGLSTFGRVSGSLLVGEAKIKERFVSVSEGAEPATVTNQQKYKDDCFCIPGVQIQTGIAYHTCFCNIDFLLRVGYEYVSWINAPAHILYNMSEPGKVTGFSQNSVTLQGFFGGAAFTF
jgi:hypothetical protein